MHAEIIEKEGGILQFDACGIERLSLDKFLGKGGFGSAWIATDQATGQQYCLKLIRAIHLDSEEALNELAIRVKNEAGVKIPSKYVVDAIGFREYGPGEFAVLFELFANAQSLFEWMQENVTTATWARKRHILQQALQGLAAAHTWNIVHRDIKPGNILVNDRDEVRVIDFGIGKFKHGMTGASKGPTVPGSQLGTIPYMAPELWIDASVADSRCDVYAFGHVLFEMLTGVNVWIHNGWMTNRGPAIMAFLEYMQHNTHLYDPDALEFPTEPGVIEVLRHSIAFDPDQRYPSAQDMLRHWFGVDIETLVRGAAPGRLQPDRARFIVAEGPTRGVAIPVSLNNGEAAVLGRKHIDFDNRFLSRKHAQVERHHDRFFVSDLGSLNGTVYNGHNLGEGERIEIHHGDHVRLADTFLEFSLSAA